MASIQQSMNALVGSALGAATTGSYFYRQSSGYQARQLEKGVEKINKQFSLHGDKTIQEASPEERAHLLKAGEEGTKLRERAFEMAPTTKRLENLSNAEGSLKTLKQVIAEVEEREKEEREAAEREAAEREAIEQQLQEAAEAYMEENAFESFITPKVVAEQKALDRLTDKIDTQTAQKQAYKDRLDTLREKASAKERGQLDTMIGRLRNKGEFE